MNAVAYVRVSTECQLERFGGTGLDRQEAICCEWASVSNMPVVKVFREEGISGTRDEGDRPAFQEMLVWLKIHSGTAVVVEALDRLARSFRVQEDLIRRLIEEEVELYSANTGENVTEAFLSDPMRRALVRMQGIFAELDKDLTVKRLRDGIKRKRIQDGEAKGFTGKDAYLHGRCDGRKPFGFFPEEQATLDLILSYRRSGMATDIIAETLNVQGIATRSGGKWIGQTIRKILTSQSRGYAAR